MDVMAAADPGPQDWEIRQMATDRYLVDHEGEISLLDHETLIKLLDKLLRRNP